MDDKVDKPPNCFLPTKFYRSPNEDGEKLRHHLILMMFLHVFLMIIFECWLWTNFVGLAFFMSFVYLYICFAGMMTINKFFIFGYISFMILSVPLYFWKVIGNVGGFGSVVLCLFEMTVYAYGGGFITIKRLSFFMSSAPGW